MFRATKPSHQVLGPVFRYPNFLAGYGCSVGNGAWVVTGHKAGGWDKAQKNPSSPWLPVPVSAQEGPWGAKQHWHCRGKKALAKAGDLLRLTPLLLYRALHIRSCSLLFLFHNQQQVGRSGLYMQKEDAVGAENMFLTFRDMYRESCLPGAERGWKRQGAAELWVP